jgi:pimeloyl-ACP methyl ester carboxylesterase
LTAADVPVTAVELPLTSLDDDVAATRHAISHQGGEVIVLGHSYGGLVISEAASGMSEVSRLVYLAALMINIGEDMFELMIEHESEMLGASVPEGNGFVVDRTRAAQLLYGDSDEAVVESLLPRLRPMHVQSLRAQRLPAWHDTPTTYVICSNDRAIPPSLQRQMATRADVVEEWPTDHSPFLTRPAAIAALLSRCGS